MTKQQTRMTVLGKHAAGRAERATGARPKAELRTRSDYLRDHASGFGSRPTNRPTAAGGVRNARPAARSIPSRVSEPCVAAVLCHEGGWHGGVGRVEGGIGTQTAQQKGTRSRVRAHASQQGVRRSRIKNLPPSSRQQQVKGRSGRGAPKGGRQLRGKLQQTFDSGCSVLHPREARTGEGVRAARGCWVTQCSICSPQKPGGVARGGERPTGKTPTIAATLVSSRSEPPAREARAKCKVANHS